MGVFQSKEKIEEKSFDDIYERRQRSCQIRKR